MTKKRETQPFATIDPNRVLTGVPHESIVYFLRIGESVKIGTSTNMKTRLTALALLPKNIVLLVPGGLITEREYHLRFKSLSIQGEWFRYAGTLRDYLEIYVNRIAERATELLTSDYPEPATDTPADNPGADDIPAMTLREMCDANLIPMRYSAAKRARTRAGDTFPSGETSPLGTLYRPRDVIDWHTSRRGSGRSAERSERPESDA